MTSQTRSDSSMSTAGQRPPAAELVSSQGKTSIADSVVQKIAGIATREVSGVYKLGGGAEKIAKIHKQGKLTARERINLLFDEDAYQQE